MHHTDDATFSPEWEQAMQASKTEKDWGVPSGYFNSRQTLLESALHDEILVPDNYFETQAAMLQVKLKKESVESSGIRVLRLWGLLAAACAVGVALFVYSSYTRKEPSFADQLEQSNLEFEDLHEIEFDESIYEEFIVEDTIVCDTTAVQKTPIDVHDFKPSKGQHVITWDDIDDEDIREYLKDEEQFNVIDDL